MRTFVPIYFGNNLLDVEEEIGFIVLDDKEQKSLERKIIQFGIDENGKETAHMFFKEVD